MEQSPPSTISLNLLRLLVQNRIAEFHTELELLSASAMENNCIKHAVELEQSFMEGAYNRVLSARQTVPHETYVYFMDLLAKTVSSMSTLESVGWYVTALDTHIVYLVESVEHPEWEIKNGAHSEHFVLASP
ncbi:hypothetical protein LOK49_LG13G00935 [Camellia lanceoleosa]|uniref:Uncharacterized protein n=1 Tax=Camellia lanceoleosa TaxID=1840588 RepID=A0ACC0FKV2_9ERIC|nr:hypothetical protein LOK49_LG13G00935 [Camellia lanceoleosa]